MTDERDETNEQQAPDVNHEVSRFIDSLVKDDMKADAFDRQRRIVDRTRGYAGDA